MSSPSVSSHESDSDRPLAEAFASKAAIFSCEILKLAAERRAKLEKTDTAKVPECDNFMRYWLDFAEFSRQFATSYYIDKYGSGDTARRLDVVILCSFRFEHVYQTLVEVDAKRDTWRFPDWFEDNEEALMNRFYNLRTNWYDARQELCALLEQVPDQGVGWKIDMSPIICNDAIDKLPSWVSIENTETKEICEVSLTEGGYSHESTNDATMGRAVDSIKRDLETLSGTERDARVWVLEYGADC